MHRVGAVLTILIGGFLALSGLERAVLGRISATWPSTQGTVLASEVEAEMVADASSVTSGGQKVEYRPRITYIYTVAGRVLTNNQYSVDELTYSQHSAHAVVRNHRPGSKVTVHYRRGQPDQAVLVVGSSVRAWLLAGAGGYAVVWGMNRLLSKKRSGDPEPDADQS
ncbi:MAG: DUF3592 domain-containing protein [Verrucomicrobiales bacterium]|nr:DUF3592 domain-containing protein [Verrucomicrobiales bacterium]